jgi:RNA polymerase sigma factor (sigma-70 family)
MDAIASAGIGRGIDGTGEARTGEAPRLGYGFVAEQAARIDRLARAVARTGDRDEARDVAQDVALSLLRVARRGHLDPARIEHVEAYLRVAVRNGARRARARRREELLHDGDVDALAERTHGEQASEHTGALGLEVRRTAARLRDRLRPRDAQAFALMIHEGMAIDEVARTLGTTTNHVHQMRHRILGEAKRLHAENDARFADLAMAEGA